MNAHNHARKLCRFCHDVMEQCRCMAPNKSTTWAACDDCLAKVARGEKLVDRSDSGPGGDIINALESMHRALHNAQEYYRLSQEGGPRVARMISLQVAREQTKATLLFLDAIKED